MMRSKAVARAWLPSWVLPHGTSRGKILTPRTLCNTEQFCTPRYALMRELTSLGAEIGRAEHPRRNRR
jgi:hypothetical protein